MAGKHRKLEEMPDEWFLRGLEGVPVSQSEYARIMGIPRQTLIVFLREKRPELWTRIKRTLLENAHASSQDRDTQERSAREARAAEEAAMLAAADVTTLTGRKIQNLENRNKELRERNADLNRKLLNQHNLLDEIVAASTEPLPKPSYKVRRSGANQKKPKRAVLLPIFDAQYGQRVRTEDTPGGIGGFDSVVFAKRANTYVEKVSHLMQAYAAGHDLTHLVFALGGDMVEGDEIFKGQEWQLELTPPEAVIGMRDHLAWIIDALMEAAAELGVGGASVLCTPGNHGKVGGRGRGARPSAYSWDMMVYKLLEERLKKHPLANFVIEQAGNCTFDVAGNLFGMIHGDEIKAWGSLPFYGLTRHDARMMRTLNVIPHYVLLGHHHQPASIPIGYGEYLMSGNWVGANNLSRIVGSNTPSQWLYFVSEDWGVCDRSLILLDERRQPKPVIHETA